MASTQLSARGAYMDRIEKELPPCGCFTLLYTLPYAHALFDSEDEFVHSLRMKAIDVFRPVDENLGDVVDICRMRSEVKRKAETEKNIPDESAKEDIPF